MIYGTREWLDEHTTTNNINEAIFIMNGGTLVSGDFDCGSRGLDHNTILALAPDELSQIEKWEWIHENTNVVRLVPETLQALIHNTQSLSDKQRELLSNSDYEVILY